MNNETYSKKSANGITLVLGGTGKTGRRVAEKIAGTRRGDTHRIKDRKSVI